MKFADVAYVLHAFQQKSKRGTKTPAKEIDKIAARLKEAQKHHEGWAQEQKRKDQAHQ